MDNLVLFHAIGKILYNKRRPSDDDTTESTNQMQLDASRWNESYFSSYCPEPLLHTMREPLRFIPELVYESAHVGADTFNGFLFQNYPIFFQDIEELDEATEYLSIGDVLRGNWRVNEGKC